MTKHYSKKSISFTLISSGLIFLISFVLTEVALRLIAPFTSLSVRTFIGEEAYRGTLSALRVAQGNRIILQRGELRQPKDMVIVGDSMVFGTMASENELFSTLLARRSGLRVINLGVGSVGLCAYNYMLKLGLNQEPNPRAVVYTIFANDFEESRCPPDDALDYLYIWEDDYRKALKYQLRRIREQLFQHSIAYQMVKRLSTFGQLLMSKEKITAIPYTSAQYDFLFASPEWWKAHLQALLIEKSRKSALSQIEDAKNAAEQKGVKFIALLMPFKEQIYTPLLVAKQELVADAYDPIYDQVYDELARLLDAIDVRYLDLRQPFREAAVEGKKLFWTLDGHLTPEGHKLVAEKLEAWLQTLGFSAKSDKDQ